MDNKILIKIEKVVAYIFCALILLFLIATIIDLIHFIKKPSDCHFVIKDAGDKEGVASYIIKGFLLIVSSFIILGLSLWRLIKPNKILRLVFNVV